MLSKIFELIFIVYEKSVHFSINTQKKGKKKFKQFIFCMFYWPSPHKKF